MLHWRVRNFLSNPLMRSDGVEVTDISPLHVVQMRFDQNDELVETLFADRAYPAFGIGVRPRRPNGRMDNFDLFRCKDSIEGSAVLAIVIPNKMRKRLLLRLQLPEELMGLLGHPSLRRMSGNAGYVDTTRSDFDEKEDIQSLEANSLDGEEIARQQSVLVVIEERSPR